MDNRVGRAKTYLSKAGPVSAPKRGEYVITAAGRKVFASKPKHIDAAFLQGEEPEAAGEEGLLRPRSSG